MKASFGKLGKVSLHFRPSGKVRRVKIPKTCLKHRPPVVSARLGTFVGTIKFRGERGYTTVSAHRVKGGIGDPLAIGDKELHCEGPNLESEKAQELKEIMLKVSLPKAGIVANAFGVFHPVVPRTQQTLLPAITEQDRYLFVLFLVEGRDEIVVFHIVRRLDRLATSSSMKLSRRPPSRHRLHSAAPGASGAMLMAPPHGPQTAQTPTRTNRVPRAGNPERPRLPAHNHHPRVGGYVSLRGTLDRKSVV
jgi:hypothetical protein